MKLVGYIEGYYGRELTGEQRQVIIDRLYKNGCNAYLIGSKEDPYHRVHWRTTPPESYLNELRQLIEFGNDRGVVVIPAIAPGLDYDFNSPEDEALLIRRLNDYYQCGAEKIAVLMDDLPLVLPETIKVKNVSLGAFHGALIRRIAKVIPAEKLLFCPTLYTNELFGTGEESDNYLPDLRATLPESVSLFWTGKNTIAETIDRESCRSITDLFGERVIFWDNIYANDYATTRLFVGPYEQRDHSFIMESTGGCMINPTGMIETDLFLIDLFGSWLRSGTSSDSQWKVCARSNGIPESFESFLPWFRSPFSFPNLDNLSESDRQPLSFFDQFLVQWQGDLKREWYPYLHRFFTELKLLTGKVGSGPWFEQRFYPFTAQKLRGNINEGVYNIL